jgi:hypothetical protein
VVIILGMYGVQFVFADEVQNDTLINAANVIKFVNKERVENGLAILQENELLDTVAQKKLDDMLKEDYFAHISPEGVDPWQWFFDAGYDFAYAGENLATNYADVIKQHEAWMNSPKHRKNILDKRFTHTGVAVGHKKSNGKDVTVTVQVFATPQKISITSSNFTPETFEVPETLFHKEVKNISDSVSRVELFETNPLQENVVSVYDKNKKILQENSYVRMLIWIIIGLITLSVIIVEYRIFIRKQK